MRLVARCDIEAPFGFVQQTLTDFEIWERAAMRRGAEVSRTDALRKPAAGMSWLTRFDYRGKARVVAIQLLKLDPAGQLVFFGSSASIEAEVKFDLLELSARRTRMHVVMDVKPRTLGARLFLQSLRLARSRVDNGFDSRVETLAVDIETRYRASRPA